MNVVKLVYTSWMLVPRGSKEWLILTVSVVILGVALRIAYPAVGLDKSCSADTEEICELEPQKERFRV